MCPFNRTSVCLVVASLLVTHSVLAEHRPVTTQNIPDAYHRIAHHFGVPVDLWFAILLQESGAPYRGRLLPWPWTLNVAGKPYRFTNKTQMTAFLCRVRPAELNRIDIGFGQIHWGSHKAHFRSMAELADPMVNLSYSAWWFKRQYAASNDWWTAVGQYHAPNNPTRARKYRRAVKNKWSTI